MADVGVSVAVAVLSMAEAVEKSEPLADGRDGQAIPLYQAMDYLTFFYLVFLNAGGVKQLW